MRVLIDTNVLFSAALNPNGTPFQAYVKAVTPPNTGIICRQNIEELRRTFNRKLPHKIQALESFLAVSMLMLEVVPVPEAAYASEKQVRDVKTDPFSAQRSMPKRTSFSRATKTCRKQTSNVLLPVPLHNF